MSEIDNVIKKYPYQIKFAPSGQGLITYNNHEDITLHTSEDAQSPIELLEAYKLVLKSRFKYENI